MAKKHTNISDEQQMVLADIQADPRILFTPKYSQWRDYIRRTSPNYLDRLYTSLPYEQQEDIYQNDREAWGALSNEAKGNFGGAQVRKKTDEVSPYVAGALGLVGAAPAMEAVAMFPMLENGLNAYFGYEGAKNLPTAVTDAYDYAKKGDWSRAGLSAGEAVLDGMFIGNGIKGIKGISNAVKLKSTPETMEFYHGGLDSDFDFNNLDVLKLAKKQAKKGKDYAGFYMYDPSLKMGAYKYGEGIGAHKINIDKNAKVLDLGNVERISRAEIQKYKDLGYDMLTGKDVRGRKEYMLLNKGAIKNTEYISPEVIDRELSSIKDVPRVRFKDRVSDDAPYMPNTYNTIFDNVMNMPSNGNYIPSRNYFYSQIDNPSAAKYIAEVEGNPAFQTRPFRKFNSEDETLSYLRHNSLGRTRKYGTDSFSQEQIDEFDKGFNDYMKDYDYQTFNSQKWEKAGKEDLAGFHDPENKYIAAVEDSKIPLKNIMRHEVRHAYDNYGDILSNKQHDILDNAYGSDFVDLPKKVAGNDPLKGYSNMGLEKTTTNLDARKALLKGREESASIEVQNMIIDKMTDEKIIEAVRNSNGYGRRYIEYLEENNLLTPQKVQAFRDAMKYVGIGIGVGLISNNNNTALDVFLTNEQKLQQQGEEHDPRDFANGGRLMITKRNKYRPHYFEDGSFMNGTAQSGSGMNWGSVGWGAAGAASGLMGQIGVSEKNPNGLWDAADPMHYLANGRTSKFGDGASKIGIGLTQAGLSTGNPWLIAAGGAVKIIGDIGNAGWGHKTDEEQLARVNQGINAGNNFQSNASSFDDLQNPMILANAGKVYEGGWFNKKKWRKKNEELQANVAEAQANVYNQFNNNVSNLQQDQMSNMLANYAAFGGPLHTHGSDWTNGITYVDNGGSHESNPYGGVPMGIAQDGQPNLVEEGEVIYKLNGSPYVYSKRLKMSKELKDKYKFKGDTFADGALEAQKESEERPNDPISQRGLNAIMMDLANEQEKKRAEKAEREARIQAKQATYAYGGHMFEKGSYLNGPGKLAYYNGRFYTLNEDDGKWYSEDGKYYISNPSERKGMQFYTGEDFEIEEDWRERMSNPYSGAPYARKQAEPYIDPLDTVPNITTNWNYTDYVNRMHAEADAIAQRNQILSLTAADLNPVSEEDLFYKSNPQFIDPVRGRVPMDYITNILGTYAIDPKLYNSDWWNGGYKAQTATQTVPSTSTSKSTSTGKGTGTTTSRGTTGVKGNRAVDQADWDRAKNWFLSSNKESYLNTISDGHWKELQDRFPKLKNYTPEQWVARAESGNIGPVYNAMMDIYNTEKPYLDYGTIDAEGTNKKALWDFYSNNKPDYFTGNQAESYVGPDGRAHTTSLEGFSTANENYLNSLGNIKGDSTTNWTSVGNTQSQSGNNTAKDVNNPINNYKTWMRYAPIFGSGLALALDPWINKPDYTNADLVLEAGKSAGDVEFNPIGDYLSYKPFDRLFYANQLAAQQAATRRALLNTTGGNAATARGLLLAADNQGINQMGNLWRQAEEYNEANRQAIAEFNRGTNMFNSEGRLKADMANQGQANVRINAAIEAAKLRALEDDRVAETRSANFTNFLDNLGDLGRENLYYNMVNNNNALYYGQNKKGDSIYKGEGSTNNPVTIQPYTKKGKNGGYLTIKKKKK